MQFKNGFMKVTAVVLSAALTLAPAMTSFAADETSQGVGNILAYNVETVVVPTAIKLVINPNGYTINMRYNKVAENAAYSESTKYYNKQSDGSFKEVKIASTDWTTAKATAYTADTSTDQVVSFNYGIASKATRDKTVTVRFDVTADSGIEFVDDADKILPQADPSDATDVGAPQDSYRIFLNLVPAKVGESITTETKEKATTYAASTTYYKIDDGKYVEDASITDAEKFAAATYQLYKDSTAIGSEIRASELADVTMVKSTAPINFEGEDGKAAADVAYMLYHATYNVKEGEILDWDTSYENIADKFELTGIAQVSTTEGSEHNGGYSGFTFTGSMNTNTDWSDLTTRTITIKPTYEFANATGAEEEVDTGLNQVEAGERTATTTPSLSKSTISSSANSVTISNGTVTTVVLNKANGTKTTLTSGTHYSISDDTLTFIATTMLDNNKGATITVTFSDETTATLTIQ